jgi:Hypothetical glycosyl hydrolase family 15
VGRRSVAAWIRYGGPISPAQVEFAIEHYTVAILQPWETEVAARLKSARPDMTVLCYKCLSSTRSFEPGPIFTSGVSYAEAEARGERWFAHRRDGVDRIEWNTYPGHWQMAVWDAGYRERWCDNVAAELAGSPWDGVMADNDVYDDYYGLCPPIEGDRGLPEIRTALDQLVTAAGTRLGAAGKLLVPNIAESRRAPGRWARHSRFGGGFEEVWLAWGPDQYLDVASSLAQADQAAGPGLTVLRVASDGTDTHQNVLYGLAAFWVFGGGRGAYAATAHDDYSGTPFVPQYRWDLGRPVEDIRRRGNARARSFTGGWAAVNLNSRPRGRVTFTVPPDLTGPHGGPAPRRITLGPHEGVLLRRAQHPAAG